MRTTYTELVEVVDLDERVLLFPSLLWRTSGFCVILNNSTRPVSQAARSDREGVLTPNCPSEIDEMPMNVSSRAECVACTSLTIRRLPIWLKIPKARAVCNMYQSGLLACGILPVLFDIRSDLYSNIYTHHPGSIYFPLRSAHQCASVRSHSNVWYIPIGRHPVIHFFVRLEIAKLKLLP